MFCLLLGELLAVKKNNNEMKLKAKKRRKIIRNVHTKPSLTFKVGQNCILSAITH